MRAAAERVAHAKATGDPARAGPKHRFSPAYVANLARVGAKYLLGIEGKGEQADLLRAFLFFKQAAQFGHVGANYELGVMYREVYRYNKKKEACNSYEMAIPADAGSAPFFIMTIISCACSFILFRGDRGKCSPPPTLLMSAIANAFGTFFFANEPRA